MAQHKLEMITLHYKDSELKIAPSLGGAIISLTYGNQSIFRPVDVESLKENPSVRLTACYPLVPFSNRIREGQFVWEGTSFHLRRNFGNSPHAIHGNGWQSTWQVDHTTRNESTLSNNLTLVMHHTPTLEGDWPFYFKSEQIFSLYENKLVMTLNITNLGEHSMPCGLGWHPFFERTPQMHCDLYAKSRWLNDDSMIPSTEQKLSQEEIKSWLSPLGPPPHPLLDHCFSGFDGKITIKQPELQRTIKLQTDSNLTHVVVFTPSHGEFIAIEPVSHRNAALNSPSAQDLGIKSLNPSEQFSVSCCITIEPA